MSGLNWNLLLRTNVEKRRSMSSENITVMFHRRMTVVDWLNNPLGAHRRLFRSCSLVVEIVLDCDWLWYAGLHSIGPGENSRPVIGPGIFHEESCVYQSQM